MKLVHMKDNGRIEWKNTGLQARMRMPLKNYAPLFQFFHTPPFDGLLFDSLVLIAADETKPRQRT